MPKKHGDNIQYADIKLDPRRVTNWRTDCERHTSLCLTALFYLKFIFRCQCLYQFNTYQHPVCVRNYCICLYESTSIYHTSLIIITPQFLHNSVHCFFILQNIKSPLYTFLLASFIVVHLCLVQFLLSSCKLATITEIKDVYD